VECDCAHYTGQIRIPICSAWHLFTRILPGDWLHWSILKNLDLATELHQASRLLSITYLVDSNQPYFSAKFRKNSTWKGTGENSLWFKRRVECADFSVRKSGSALSESLPQDLLAFLIAARVDFPPGRFEPKFRRQMR
ncbi:MAG: hypothetical protein WBX19_10635, partial [Terracidiphilus sp.]